MGRARHVRAVLSGLVVAATLAGGALADRKATFRIEPPFVPEGYVLEETSDCTIVSSGGAPDARLDCAPGLGWRMLTQDGRVVFPTDGYMPRDAAWAFPGAQTGAFLSHGQVEIVSLNTGAARRVDFNRLEQVRSAQGLPTLAVIWNRQRPEGDEPVPARLVGADGAVGEPLPGSDMRGVEGARGYTDCWNAVILSASAAETLPNTVWKELRRASGEADGALACGPYLVPALAGRDDDGWRLLHPGTLMAASSRMFGSAEEALTAGRGD